jgi:hypothetical protein
MLGARLPWGVAEDWLDESVTYRYIVRCRNDIEKDLGDIARLVESHPRLWQMLPQELQGLVQRPAEV